MYGALCRCAGCLTTLFGGFRPGQSRQARTTTSSHSSTSTPTTVVGVALARRTSPWCPFSHPPKERGRTRRPPARARAARAAAPGAPPPPHQVMELMDGGDLFDTIVDPHFDYSPVPPRPFPTLPPREGSCVPTRMQYVIASVLRDCCAALAFMHAKGAPRGATHACRGASCVLPLLADQLLRRVHPGWNEMGCAGFRGRPPRHQAGEHHAQARPAPASLAHA